MFFPGGEGDALEPFRSGHEAVIARDDESGREPVLMREWFIIHPDRQQGVAIKDCSGREAGCEVVGPKCGHLICGGIGPGHFQDVGKGNAEPFGMAYQTSTHFVGDAGQRGVLLYQFHIE